METMSIRQQKVARQIQSDMAEIFQRDGKPCTLGTLVTVTAELGRRVKNQLKVVPELQFFLDDSLEYIRNIEEKLK